MTITFTGELPERVYVDYVTYKVRPFEKGPLRCYCCQAYGHAAAVCRGVRKCGRCGEERCNEECKTERSEPTCIHCKGAHYAGSAQCPKRKREERVRRVRVESGITYAEAVKRVEGGSNESGAGKNTEENTKREDQTICMDKRQFLAFIAMVVNCAVEMKGKSERIMMVLDAARRFLKIEDISGGDIDRILRDGFAPTQAGVPGP